jgi:hypothetical protein
MPKNVKPSTLTHAHVADLARRDAVVKNIEAQLDNAMKGKKSAAQLVVTMKSVKAKLGKLPPHFGRPCNV